MSPERASNEQAARYRRRTGEQRLALALELQELSCNAAREGIRHQNPDADEAEVERLWRRRLKLARSCSTPSTPGRKEECAPVSGEK